MSINRFEDIIAWQKAKDLTLKLYALFLDCKDVDFANQIQHASVLIMSNIAFGFELNNEDEFKQSLFKAKSSCGEVSTLLIVAHELEMISTNDYTELGSLSEEISKIIAELIKTHNIKKHTT